MQDRDPPPAHSAGPDVSDPRRDVADWQPVGGALAASIVIHALAIGSLAVLFIHPSPPPVLSSVSTALSAVLTGAQQLGENPAAEPVTVTAHTSTAGPTLPIRAPTSRSATGHVPWTGTPPTVDPPLGLFGKSMVSEGLEIFEMRSVVRLGVDIERRIRAEYPDEPEYPVVLKPAETIGYPLDALAAGVEGTVLVWFGVDEEGKVVAKEGLDGPTELLDWVLERIDRLVARPATNKDGPVRAWVALEINFTRAIAEEAQMRAAKR